MTSLRLPLVFASASLCSLQSGVLPTASAQELVTLTWSFTEVLANTTTPVSANGFLEPGEGALIRLSISYTPAVGTILSYTPPPGSGLGQLAGLASVNFDLVSGPGAEGTWNHLSRLTPWSIGSAGTITPGGVLDASVGQFPLPGQVANPANPINNLWRVVWTPSDYTPRTAIFTPRLASGAQPGQMGAALYLDWAYVTEEPRYISKAVPAAFGSLQIPVIPAPSSLLVMCALAAHGSRRRR